MAAMGTPLEWCLFGGLVLGMLLIDLLAFNRHARNVRIRDAVIWSIVWISLALGFNVLVYYDHGKEAALQFFTAYLVEKSLSVDNLFVFLAVFGYFKIPPRYQHRVLFWGVLGALVMRIAFIAAGTALLSRFEWMLYLFGAFLVYTGVKLGVGSGESDPATSLPMRIARRFLRVSPELDGEKFFTRRNGVRMATPLLMVLVVIEFSDVLFAFDSVPAVLGISTDLFIVYTSNVFAILGLRALYFVLAGVLGRLRFLHVGLAVILVFIGGKMLLNDVVHVSIGGSLGFIGGVIGMSILASLAPARRDSKKQG